MLSIKHLTYLTFAIAATALAVMIMKSPSSSTTAVKQEQAYYVLAPKQPIAEGEVVDFTKLRWKNVTKETIDAAVAVITKDGFEQSSISNKVAVRDLNTDDMLHSGDLISSSDSAYLTTVLNKNKRAIAISVNSQSAIAGLVQPGDWVDVMFYHELARRDDQDAWKVASSKSSRQLVENVRLLAIDHLVNRSANQPDSKREFSQQSTVTLEVSVAQAQQLYLAQNLGDLSLLLRANDAPSVAIEDTATEMADVLSQFSDENEQANMVFLKGSTQVMSGASAKTKEKQ